MKEKRGTIDSFFDTNNMGSKEAVEYVKQHPLSLVEMMKQIERNHQKNEENEKKLLFK